MISKEPEAIISVFTVVISEKGGAERREFFDRAELSVGRVQGNDLMLPKGNVSKRHARLLYRDGRFIVTDLNSTNGTYVNRRRIAQATIVREGDRIYIGDFVLRIEVGEESEVAASERTGSGPAVSAPSSASNALEPETRAPDGAPADPEDSGLSYPKVPAPPKVPSGARLELTSDAHSSGRVAIAEVVRPSIVERIAPAALPEERGDDDAAALRRRALALAVERVKESVGLVTVPDEVDAVLLERIERAIQEYVASAQASAELSALRWDGLAGAIRAELLELGPLSALLAEAQVGEITVSRFDRVVALRDQQLVTIEPPFSSEAALGLAIRRLCRKAGLAVSGDETIIERRMPDGTRLSAMLGAAAPAGALLVIRRPRQLLVTLEELVRRGTISRAIATFLQQCLSARVNLLVLGPADSGVNALLSALCGATSDGRVVALQELDDVWAHTAPLTRLATPERFDEALHMLRLAMSVPASRLFVELSRRELAAALVEVIGEGADGVVAALRAPNVRRALARLSADVMASSGMSLDGARESIASSFDLVLEVSKLRDGRQRVLRVSEITGAGGGEIQTQDIFTFAIERTAAGGSIEGTFNSSGVVPRVAEEMRARGLALETSLFTRPPSR